MPTATHPETGEFLILDSSGQWTPPKTAENPQTGEKLYFDGEWKTAPDSKDPTGGKKPIDGPKKSTFFQGLIPFADEVAAGGRASGAFLRGVTREGKGMSEAAQSAGETYDQTLAAERGQVKKFRDENPGTAIGLEVAGGLAAAPAAALATAPSYAGTIARATGAGALYGFGSGEGLEDRAVGGGIGGLAAGSFAAAAPVIASWGAKAGRYVGDLLGLTDADKVATRKLVEAFERDGISPDDAASRIRQWQAQGAKPEMLFDVGGENVRGLARASTQIPGAGRNQAVETLANRQAGQGERVADDIAKSISPNNRFYDTMDDLGRIRAEKAAPLYDKALSTAPVHSDRLKEFIDSPEVREGIKRGMVIQRREALAAGQKFNPTDYGITGFNAAGDPVMGNVPNMRLLDAGKKGIDDMLESYRDKTTGKLVLDEAGRALDRVRRSYIGVLDDLNPAYKEARAAWSGPSQSRDAMSLGREIFKKDSDLTAKAISDLSEGDREFFKAGVVRALKDIADNTKDGADITKRIAATPGMRGKLRAAFDSDQDFAAFMSQITREKNMYSNAQFVSPKTGSQTTPRALDNADLAEDPALGIIGRALMGDFSGAARQGGQALMARPESARPSVAEALVKALYSDNGNANLATVNRLLQNRQQSELSAAQRAALARALLTGSGAGIGSQTN